MISREAREDAPDADLAFMTTIFAQTKAILIALIFPIVALVNFVAQTPQPSPSASPGASPSVSPSPTAAPTQSPTPLPGNQNFHQWGSVTVFNGLPSDSVRAIAQTPDGVMWFGTDNGLARFDGRRIQKLQLGDPDDDRILALETSPAGELWIGTGSGAFIYVDGRFQPVGNTNDTAITSIAIGTAVFLGTDGGFVLRVSGDLRTPVAERVNADPVKALDGSAVSITSLLETHGKLLAATAGRGMVVLNGSEFQQLVNTPVPGGANSLAVSSTGELWAGTDAARGVSGVYSADPNGSGIKRIAAATAKVLTLEVNEIGLWTGTERYGLFQILDGKVKKSYTFANTSGGLRSDTIYTLFTDREGVLWIGTNRGASRFDQQGSFQQTVSEVPNSNFIRALARPRYGFFAGSNRGLFQYDGDKWRQIPALGNRPIYTIHVNSYDADRGMLVGTGNGTFDGRGRLIAAGDTRSIQNFRQIYAAILGRGVVNISSSKQEVLFPDPSACSLLVFRDRLWIGTTEGGLFSSDGQTVRPEVTSADLKSGAIWKLSAGSQGEIWIAAQHGVFRTNDGRVEKIIEAEDVRDVLGSDQDVWAASTTRGLLHARRDERFGWITNSMGFEQGLPSEKVFAIEVGDGLLVATNRGVVAYQPGDIPPKLIATRILSQRVHDLSELRSIIALEYPQNSILVEVAGQSSRTFPEEFQYAFVLKNTKGEEMDRRLTNDPQYAPADLSPGTYSIEAIAFNRDLLSSDPLVISFSIERAPFPLTATALGVLLVLSLIGLVWAVVERRRIKHRNRELAAARLDLANEAERERRRIARDLHDQTLADLRNLMMETDKLSVDGIHLRKEIESISTDIRRICEDLSPSVLENVGLVAALEFLLSHTVENHKFSSDEDLEERMELPLNVQLQIYRIAQEVLTNIVRHSSATEVEMRVRTNDEGEFILAISDNGNVFQPDGGAPKGRGIQNIRSRANLISGKVAWKESRRGGNVFSLRVRGNQDRTSPKLSPV